MCRDQAHRCQIQCDGQNKKSYGAIAYSAKDEGAGWSYGFSDLSKAKKVAMDNCSHNGRHASCGCGTPIAAGGGGGREDRDVGTAASKQSGISGAAGMLEGGWEEVCGAGFAVFAVGEFHSWQRARSHRRHGACAAECFEAA